MLLHLFEKSDIVKYPLLLFSVLALCIVMERIVTLTMLKQREEEAFVKLQSAMEQGDHSAVNSAALSSAAPVSQVIAILTTMRGASFDALQAAADSALGLQRLRLRRYLTMLATIGSTAPFIGLFGTVLGVLQAFEEMGRAGSNVEGSAVAGNIGAALSATAVGLLVAIPTVIAYNYLVGKVQGQVLQVSSHVARLMPYLESRIDNQANHATPHTILAARATQEA